MPANLYYVSKYYLENGFEFCTLFVDKKNPIARAYEKIDLRSWKTTTSIQS